jgi:hypothetical protein
MNREEVAAELATMEQGATATFSEEIEVEKRGDDDFGVWDNGFRHDFNLQDAADWVAEFA